MLAGEDIRINYCLKPKELHSSKCLRLCYTSAPHKLLLTASMLKCQNGAYIIGQGELVDTTPLEQFSSDYTKWFAYSGCFKNSPSLRPPHPPTFVCLSFYQLLLPFSSSSVQSCMTPNTFSIRPAICTVTPHTHTHTHTPHFLLAPISFLSTQDS